MPPPKNQTKKAKQNSVLKTIKSVFTVEFVKSCIFDPAKLPLVSIGILLAELVLNVFIVERVNYTEIDWIAYMQECEGFLNGTTNYGLLKGDTGPLVYPAGFVYIYSFLYFITSKGANIKLAQYIFIGIYLLQLGLVLRLYAKSRKLPPYVVVITTFTSYRIHSIYVLRLFNDPIAILFLYLALNLYMDGKWSLGSVCLSLGVSVKMNILLFAPAILLLYITSLGYLQTLKQIFICGILQIVLALPFLTTYPIEYIKGSFDLGRIFEHKWTVNYRFLPREIFESKTFHLSLLVLHLGLLGIFGNYCYKYMQSYCRLRSLQKQLEPQIAMENKRIKKEKTESKAKKPAPVKEEEKLTDEQQKFLNSFEKSMKSMNPTANPVPIKEEPVKTPDSYSIHFDKCTQLALLPIFLCNFIGIMCSRSLHYQFYVWYFHSLPYLTWFTHYKTTYKFLLLGLIEFAWNTYPSTNISSALLHVCHFILLIGIFNRFYNQSKTLKTN